MENTEVQNIEVRQPEIIKDVSVENFISRALELSVPVETMERLFALRKDVKAEQAKEAFIEAMSKLQGECPVIKKTKEVKTKTGVVAYRYAPIDSIVEQVKDLLQKHGFSYSTQIHVQNVGVKAVCVVQHILGHSENYEMEVPLGNKTEIMSASQVVAAASTFAKRYAFCNAFGIMSGDEDIDGADLPQSKSNSSTNKTTGSKEQQKPVQQKAKPQWQIEQENQKREIAGLLKDIFPGELNNPDDYKSVALSVTGIELMPKNYRQIIIALKNKKEILKPAVKEAVPEASAPVPAEQLEQFANAFDGQVVDEKPKAEESNARKLMKEGLKKDLPTDVH